MTTCKPHRWDYENWLPLIASSRPADYDAMTCLNCGKVLAIADTSPNMRASITHAIASRIYGGDEHAEVSASMREFFEAALERYRSRRPPGPPAR